MARKKKAAVAKVASPAATSSEEAPKPNLKFVGKVQVVKVDIDGVTITLPAEQSEPFYHEKAVLIAQRLPNFYKTYDCGSCGK